MSLTCLVCRPNKFLSVAKCRILVLGVSVNNEVVLAQYGKVASTWREFHTGSGHLTDSKLLHVLRVDDLSVLGLFICTFHQLQVESLNFSLLNANHLSIDIGSQRLVLTEFDHNCSLIETKGNAVRLWDS